MTIEDIYYKKGTHLSMPYDMDNKVDIYYNKNDKLKCLVLSKRKGLNITELNNIVKLITEKNPNIKLHNK